MNKTQADKELVFQAAEEMHAAKQKPTIKAIREVIGYGSNTTIHKYLSQWKQAQAEKQQTKQNNTIELELADLKQQLKQQQRQNQQLAKELLNVERKLVTTENNLKEVTIAFNDQTIAYNEAQQQLQAMLKLNQEIQAERENSLSQVLQSNQQLLDQFQNDLKIINQESLNKIGEINIKNQDAWLAEKVKNKELETTITELKNKINTLEKLLRQEKDNNQPLRKKIVEQDKILAQYMNEQFLTSKSSVMD
jgi:chromosome segregation ATPase